MSKLIACLTIAICAGTAGFAATPKDPAMQREPVIQQQPVTPPLRVAPFTKSNLKGCAPTAAPVQHGTGQGGATLCS